MDQHSTVALEAVSLVYESPGDEAGGIVTFTALDEVDIIFQSGSIHVLLGENGAGKSTLVHILSGLLAPTRGRLSLNGEPLYLKGPKDALRRGIAMVHQRPLLCDELSALDNTLLSASGFLLQRKTATEQVRRINAEWGSELNLSVKAKNLSPSDRLKTALFGALLQDPAFLILDEPTAVLSPADRTSFMEAVQKEAARGRGIILITHHLEEAVRWADRITVLKKGRVKLTENKVFNQEAILAVMRAEIATEGNQGLWTDTPEEKSASGAPCTFAVKDLCAVDGNRPPLVNFSLTAHKGGITGIFGYPGSPLGTLEDALCGMISLTSGTVTVHGSCGRIELSRHTLTPRALRACSVAMVPSNRAFRGSNPVLTIQDILRATDTEYGTPSTKEGIPAQIHRLVGTLSGGQLQRLIVAKELSSKPHIIILCEPEWGLDMQSTYLLRRRLIQEAEQGATIIILTDTPETMTIPHFYTKTVYLEGELR